MLSRLITGVAGMLWKAIKQNYKQKTTKKAGTVLVLVRVLRASVCLREFDFFSIFAEFLTFLLNLVSVSWQCFSADDFDWTRQSGSTSSSGTGPTNDHTYGTAKGYYMYIETSLPRRPGDKAMLMSPKYPSTKGKCLQFWYHMYGSHTGTLNVQIKRMVGGKPTYILMWSKSGDNENRWWIAQVHKEMFDES